jgi:hypothetical protein
VVARSFPDGEFEQSLRKSAVLGDAQVAAQSKPGSEADISGVNSDRSAREGLNAARLTGWRRFIRDRPKRTINT